MATEKQIAANRANAKRSTGPKTVAGKMWSSRNAYRHGLSCPLPLDPEKVDAIALALAGDGTDEQRLAAASEVARAQLELLRVRSVRAQLITSVKIDLLAIDTLKLHRLTALDRYERYARTKRRRASDSFDAGIRTLGGDVGAVEQLM
jgi:hypothetical protein